MREAIALAPVGHPVAHRAREVMPPALEGLDVSIAVHPDRPRRLLQERSARAAVDSAVLPPVMSIDSIGHRISRIIRAAAMPGHRLIAGQPHNPFGSRTDVAYALDVQPLARHPTNVGPLRGQDGDRPAHPAAVHAPGAEPLRALSPEHPAHQPAAPDS